MNRAVGERGDVDQATKLLGNAAKIAAGSGNEEVTRRLKAAEDTRAIPVIALTTDAMAGDREKALEAGCDDYDTKPVEFARLLDKIQTLLNRKERP